MLLAVALALLVAQGISVVLQYRAGEQRREMIAANQLAFQLVADPRFDFRPIGSGMANDRRRWRRLRVERTPHNPLQPGEERDARREELLRAILIEQGIEPAELVVTRRKVADDPYVMGRFEDRGQWRDVPEWSRGDLLLAGLRREGGTQFTVARVPLSRGEPRQLGQLIAQTVLLYVLLVGGLAILLRRITRPLAALTKRVETFGETRAVDGQLEPSGPQDMRRLILAHNAMEGRIAALLDEKDVMLGAIGHDLKTPLAALRVRIESVEDATEREKMARTIEDITRSLDDILTLARVGRPGDPLERTDLGALLASVVEEYEDMGDPVTLEEGPRIAAPLRENALRYGDQARVSLARDGAEAVVRIEDDGPGIPPGEIAAMLEPFARGETSRNRVTGGAGLGLTLARAIAEQHGGRLVLANRTNADGEIAGLVAELRLPLS
jgi:signal transduction histidine kinase